jgi:hypothetical protein
MKRATLSLLTAISAVFSIQVAMAQTFDGDVLEFAPTEGPSVVSDGASTNKVKILRTPDGTLFAVYGDAQDVGMMAWNPKAGATQLPNDIVIKYSVDGGVTWSDALNIDNTAALSSARGILVQEGPPMLDPLTGTPDLVNDPRAVDYPGDSDKPNVFNIGNNLIVTFNSKYCPADETRFPGEQQRFVTYTALYGVTVPFSCQYVSRLVWDSTNKVLKPQAAWGGAVYKTDQLSSGMRDAKQDANRGNKFAHVINWQEDPLGLKLGEAEGPGSGASGANVGNGTDIWYSYIDLLNVAGTGVDPAKFVGGSYSVPVRITQNVFGTQPLEGRDVETHPPGDYDRGRVGASRPNIGQIDDTVIIAYEETKGTEGWDEGKYVRYHAFRFDTPPDGGEHGCIISDPWENARRVRFLVQSAATNEVPLLFIYKQGDFTQGGESDIMVRRAVGGFMPENLQPRVDVANCRVSIMDDIDPMYSIRLEEHGPAMNFSGTREIGGVPGTGQMFESIDTGANMLENALAHRGMMRGDLVLVGFSYVPDLARFQLLDTEAPYNFMVRRSTDGGATWSDAVNLTPAVTAESGYTVKEPRIVPTPGSGPKCATDPTDCQNPDVIYVAYGLQNNVLGYDEAGDFDIYMAVTFDAGASFSAPKAITAGDALYGVTDEFEDFETQIKLRPDGRASSTVWSGNDGLAKHAMFRSGLVRGDTQAVETVLSGKQSQVTVIPDEQSEAVLVDPIWKSPSDYSVQLQGYNLPYGVLEFTVERVYLGGQIEVTLTFPDPLPEGTSYWKFGPTHEDGTEHWYSVPATIDGNTITYVLTDGEDGDDDLAVNGTIVDPGAPAVYNPPVTPPPATSSSSGGCTIGSGDKVDPTLLLLASLSLLYLMRRRRMPVC